MLSVIAIPKQLQHRDFRFCLLAEKDKRPIEMAWQNNGYAFDDPTLLKHIAKGKNFGVMTGHGGLIVFDADHHITSELSQKQLPKTFTVKSNRGSHKYFFCPELQEKLVLKLYDIDGKVSRDEKGKEIGLGEVLSFGSQAVGPTSMHPSGKLYKIIDNSEIQTLNFELLQELVLPYWQKKSKKKASKPRASRVQGQGIREIPIAIVMDLSGFKTAPNGELYGSNPWHGSENGQNLRINTSKNVAHCFRSGCDCGLSVTKIIALERGLISTCSDTVDDPMFLQVLDYARQRGWIKIPHASPAANDIVAREPAFDFKYPTEHMPFFRQIRQISKLQGEEYVPILKGTYFFLIGVICFSKEKTILIGDVATDLRVHLLIVLASGSGKNNLKTLILVILKACGFDVHVPVSLHPEQLLGKVISRKVNKKNEYIPNYGYLAQPVLIFDEMHFLLTGKEASLILSRKFLRQAKDRYGANLCQKKSVDHQFTDREMISYHPTASCCGFTQLQQMEPSYVLDGDCRRDLVLYLRGLTNRDRTDDYRQRLKAKEGYDDALQDWVQYVGLMKELMDQNGTLEFTPEALERFSELHEATVAYGLSLGEKARNFTKMVDFSLQDWFLKLSYLLAVARGEEEITTKIVELAFLDFFEFFSMQLNYIQDKVHSRLDYGEGWQGADGKDQQALEWLFAQGARDESSSTTSIADFKKAISKIHGVGADQAHKKHLKYLKKSWIATRQGFQTSCVWLAFIPKYEGAKMVDVGNGGTLYKCIFKKYYTKENKNYPTTTITSITTIEKKVKELKEQNKKTILKKSGVDPS